MKLAIIDVETTGLDSTKHEIIEIGLVVCDSKNDFAILDTWSVKVVPERPEDGEAKAYEVNGYTADQWLEAIDLTTAMMELAQRIEGTLVMSYNISFDQSFLRAAYEKTGVKDPTMHWKLDLLTLAWSKVSHEGMWSWSLKNVCKRLGIEPEPDVHRGEAGAMKAYEVYKKLMETV